MADAGAKKPKRPRGRVHVKWEICKGCGFCVEFCPKGVLAQSDRFNQKGYHPPEVVAPDECIACNLCGLYCPDFAIFAERIKDEDDQ